MIDNNIIVHPHPACSLDLNPIEELWSILKSNIKPKDSPTYDAFILQL